MPAIWRELHRQTFCLERLTDMANPTAVTCAQVNDYFAKNDSLFGSYIHNALRETSPWEVLTPKESFPDGVGYIMRDITIEGITTANDESDWANVTQSDGATTNPLSAPNISDLAWGQSYTSWRPQYKAYKTPCISLDDMKFDHMAVSQVGKTVEQLTQVSDEILSNRSRYETARLMPAVSLRPGYGNANGIVGVTDTTNTFNKTGLAIPTATLNQTHLDDAWEYLLSQGAGAPESRMNMEDGQPVLALITSRTTSDKIINVAGIRDDYHWGDPGELLKPLGVRRVYRGYAHIFDLEIPRFDLVAGVLVRRLKWNSSSADSGSKRVLNPQWTNATYEWNYIKPMNAWARAVIKDSATKEISGASFEDHPYYYSAQAFWINTKDNTTNLLGKLGRWLLIAANASHPHYPNRGLNLLVKRCPNDETWTACSCG